MAREGLDALFPFHSHGEADTIGFGARLGGFLKPGDVIGLTGDLGAGKTHLVKGLTSAAGVPPEMVSSPTFTIAHEYNGSPPVYHLDLYRLADTEEARRAGLEDYVFGDGICVVEWPERAPDLFPADTILIRIRHGQGDERTIELLP